MIRYVPKVINESDIQSQTATPPPIGFVRKIAPSTMVAIRSTTAHIVHHKENIDRDNASQSELIAAKIMKKPTTKMNVDTTVVSGRARSHMPESNSRIPRASVQPIPRNSVTSQ